MIGIEPVLIIARSFEIITFISVIHGLTNTTMKLQQPLQVLLTLSHRQLRRLFDDTLFKLPGKLDGISQPEVLLGAKHVADWMVSQQLGYFAVTGKASCSASSCIHLRPQVLQAGSVVNCR